MMMWLMILLTVVLSINSQLVGRTGPPQEYYSFTSIGKQKIMAANIRSCDNGTDCTENSDILEKARGKLAKFMKNSRCFDRADPGEELISVIKVGSIGHQLQSLSQPDYCAPIREGSGWPSVTVTLDVQYVNLHPLGHQLQSLFQPGYDAPIREGSGWPSVTVTLCPIC
jgi:hypothetical protein